MELFFPTSRVTFNRANRAGIAQNRRGRARLLEIRLQRLLIGYVAAASGKENAEHDQGDPTHSVRRLSKPAPLASPATASARAPARWPAGRHSYTDRADVIFARALVLQTRLRAPQSPCGGTATRGMAARDYARWALHLWAGAGGRGDRLRSQELVRRASRSRFPRSGASLLAVEDLCL